MRYAGNADDVFVLGLDLWFNVFFFVESNSITEEWYFLSFFFLLSFLSASQMIYTRKI